MKKTNHDRDNGPDSAEMLREYDFTGKKDVRGKYCQAYRQGHTVKMYVDNGIVRVRHFTLEERAVMLEPGVREDFRTSESVNQAPCCLITSISRPRRRN